jgi:chaperone required for assembly of F1-ATPase
VDDAWALSRLEEDHQTARWGEDAEAAAAATRRRDFEAAARFLALLSA